MDFLALRDQPCFSVCFLTITRVTGTRLVRNRGGGSEQAPGAAGCQLPVPPAGSGRGGGCGTLRPPAARSFVCVLKDASFRGRV